MKSTEPTNIFKVGVKETGQSAPTIHRVNVYQTKACTQKACLNLFLIGLLHRSSPMIRTLSYSFGLGITETSVQLRYH